MSFNFQWPAFSPEFHADAAKMLDSALNRGPKPKVIADDIKVEDINMGKIPPDLEILEIGELSTDRFRGIFRLTYAGDAHLLLSTKVQANPLTRPSTANLEDVSSIFPSSGPSRGILFAAAPLVVPMKLRLSAVRLRAIVVLVVSKQKGITLVFKNDPLESVEVSSTFDSVAVLQKYLQQEIEGQLREMFREDLPGIIHRLSQKWLSGDAQRRAVATRQPDMHPSSTSNFSASRPEVNRAMSEQGPRSKSRKASSPPLPPMASLPSPKVTPRKASSVMASSPPRPRMAKAATAIAAPIDQVREAIRQSPDDTVRYFGTSLDDLERYDPTYGLRPDDMRMSMHSSGYSGLARLAAQTTGGLRDLTLSDADEERQSEGPLRTDEPTGAGFDTSRARSAVVSNKELERYDGDDNIDEDNEMDDDDDDVPDEPLGELNYLDEQRNRKGRRRGEEEEDDDDDDDDEEEVDDEEEEEQEVEEEGEGTADYTRYGYPPPSAAFSDTIEASARLGSASLFGSPSAAAKSPKPSNSKMRGLSTSTPIGASKKAREETRNAQSERQVEYETIPAVGGGTITRPRVYHIASRVQAPDLEEEDEAAAYPAPSSRSGAASSTARGPASSRTFTVRQGSVRGSKGPSRATSVRNRGLFDSDGNDDVDLRQLGSDDSLSHDGIDEDSPSAASGSRGSLSTLDPEPMDPRSTNYRTQLYRQNYGGVYRTGYGSSSASASGASSSDASRRLAAPAAPAAGSVGHPRTRPHLANSNSHSGASSAPTSTYPSTHTHSSPTSTQPVSDSRLQKPLPPSINISPSPSSKVLGQSPNHSMTNDASAHFADLVNSNHTLSPYTRTLDTRGFMVRSQPVTPGASISGSNSTASGAAGGGGGGSLYSAVRPSSLSGMVQHRVMGPGDVRSPGLGVAPPSSTVPTAAVGKRRTFKLPPRTASESQVTKEGMGDSTRRPTTDADATKASSTVPRYKGPASVSSRSAASSNERQYAEGSQYSAPLSVGASAMGYASRRMQEQSGRRQPLQRSHSASMKASGPAWESASRWSAIRE